MFLPSDSEDESENDEFRDWEAVAPGVLRKFFILSSMDQRIFTVLDKI